MRLPIANWQQRLTNMVLYVISTHRSGNIAEYVRMYIYNGVAPPPTAPPAHSTNRHTYSSQIILLPSINNRGELILFSLKTFHCFKWIKNSGWGLITFPLIVAPGASARTVARVPLLLVSARPYNHHPQLDSSTHIISTFTIANRRQPKPTCTYIYRYWCRDDRVFFLYYFISARTVQYLIQLGLQ